MTPETPKQNYKCRHCGQVLMRESNKQRIRSFCERTGKTVMLMRVEEVEE